MQVAESQVQFPLAQPSYLKVAGKIISYLFHPLFMPVYVAAYLIYLHPYSFAVFDSKQKLIRLISVFVITAFFPAITVFLLWRLGFAQSIFIRTQKERIIPYVSSIIYFFWAFYVSKNLQGTPDTLTSFFLGIFLAASVALIANNYFKISMHALAAGGCAMFMMILGIVSGESMGFAIAIATMLAGLICTARLLVSDHSPFELYSALVVGATAQLIAAFFML